MGEPEDVAMHDIWLRCRYVAIDVEGTASPAGQPEELVELAAVEFMLDGGTGRTVHSLLNPGRPISNFGTRAHGLRDEDVAGQPAIASICPQLAELAGGAAIVAHNAQVDWRLVHRDCPAVSPLAVIDTLRLSRALWPDLRQHGLDPLIERLGVEVTLPRDVTRAAQTAKHASRKSRDGRHTALYDAMAAAHVFVRMVTMAQERGLQVAELLERGVLPGSRVAPLPQSQMDLFAGGGE